ncbi:MAG: hypothetical protein KDK66_08655 [Deltaproteobacteria bacterium]|nr:hypothetical protein [Deltaproteobacteria bacterium]
MVFKADTALAVELLALVAGTALLVWSGKEGLAYKGFAKVVAYFTIILSFLALLCTAYHSVRYWEDGYFRTPYHQGRMGPRGMKGLRSGYQGRGFEGRNPGMRGPEGERPFKSPSRHGQQGSKSEKRSPPDVTNPPAP